jgi:hypothetical protein
MNEKYYEYWGKAKKKEDGSGYDYHLLPYHCLDVAAVGKLNGHWQWPKINCVCK